MRETRTKLLVTGGAGFIGSHLAGRLADLGHEVRILDNFATGRRSNLLALPDDVELVEGDIQSYERVHNAVVGCEVVFHEAALPSVPRSVQDPLTSNATNITGTLNVLLAARDAGVRRVVFGSSSSIYGAGREMPKREAMKPEPISPYAVAKLACENYARSFGEVYGLETVSLRYFNVFGPRQDPLSQYAAVIPNFITALMAGEPPVVFGDGEQSRDFTYVDNVVEANVLAMDAMGVAGEVFNVAYGRQTTLNQLLAELRELLDTDVEAQYVASRPGDVPHSLADCSRAGEALGYEPSVDLREGLKRTIDHYRQVGAPQREGRADPLSMGDPTFIPAFFLAAAVTFVAVPVAIRLARRTEFYDHPAGYKGHASSTPYLGGLAVFAGFAAGALAFGHAAGRFWVIFACAAGLLALGTLDDRLPLAPRWRVLAEIAAAVALYAAGLGWSVFESGPADLLLTVAWVVGLCNAFNLMDNLDGAAGTVAGVSATGIGVAAWLNSDPVTAAFAFALAGACAGFLPHNLAGPARIFLGDGGSLPIGFLVAASAMVACDWPSLRGSSVLLGALLVGLAILDTALVVFSRRRAGVPVVRAGRDHLTHRLAYPAGNSASRCDCPRVHAGLAVRGRDRRRPGGTRRARRGGLGRRRMWPARTQGAGLARLASGAGAAPAPARTRATRGAV